MVKLEDQFVDALCQQQADDCVAMMHDVTYQKNLKGFFQEMIKIMMQSLPGDFTAEMKAEFTEKLTPEYLLANILQDDDKMRQNALKNARNQFVRSKLDMESALPLKQQAESIRQESPEAATQLDNLIEKLMGRMESTWKFNSAIVSDLAKIATKSGLDKAVSPESVGAIFRKYLPTKEEYIAHYAVEAKNTEDALAEFFDALKKMVAVIAGQVPAEAKEDKEFNDVTMELDWYQKILNNIGKSMGNRLEKDFLVRGVNRIYGK